MVSPDWPALGYVVTPVSGSSERAAKLNEPDLNHIQWFFLRKEEFCRKKKWEKQVVGRGGVGRDRPKINTCDKVSR